MIGDEEEDEDKKPPVYEGPEPETIVDRVNAQPLPAGASNGRMPDVWPPEVPSEAPGMVPRATPSAPQQPQAPAAAPPVNVSQQTAQGYADQQQLGADDVAAQHKLGDVKAAAGNATADAMDADAQRRQDAADEQAQITQAANQKTQQWADRAQGENEKFMKMDLHDYWADKSTGSKVLGGLAMILGAVGRTDNSGNAGLNMINQAIERDFRMQQARIEKQKANVGAANEQYKAGLTEKEQALSDAKLKEAAATDAAAAKLAALRVRQGVPVEQAQNDADVVALKQKANQLRLGTLKDVHSMNLEDAKLEIEKQKEADERLKAEAYARKMGRVGTGGAAAKGVPELVKMKEDGAPDSEIAARAAQLGMKPKDYLPSLANVRASEKAANGGAGGSMGSVRQNAVLGNLAEAEKAAKDITPGVVSMDTINKLQSNEEQAKGAEHSATSGVLGNLGARFSRGIGLTARGRYDGIPEDQQKKVTAAEQVITHLTEMQQGKNIETLEQYRDRYSPYIPGLSEAEVRRREKALPGLVAEQRAIQDPKGIGKQRTAGLEGGGGATAVPGGKAAAAQRVLNDPKAPTLARARAKQYLDSIANNGGSAVDDIGH
jgi:hypothetical protein